MPVRIDVPLFEGDDVAQRLSEAMIISGFTRSRGARALRRTSELLSIYRLSCMRRKEDETFLAIPRRFKKVKKR